MENTWLKLLNWQTKRELDDLDLQKTMDLRMEDDLKLGRPSRLEENDQEESKLAWSNHSFQESYLLMEIKPILLYMWAMNFLYGLNKMYPFRIASNHSGLVL